ncbi:uncharacterized protein M6G45_000428 [Spheniscus humboldti]
MLENCLLHYAIQTASLLVFSDGSPRSLCVYDIIEGDATTGRCRSRFVSSCLGGPDSAVAHVVPGFRSGLCEQESLSSFPRALSATQRKDERERAQQEHAGIRLT